MMKHAKSIKDDYSIRVEALIRDVKIESLSSSKDDRYLWSSNSA